MANLFNQNPMILDTTWTANTIPAGLTAIKNGPPQSFTRIVWVGPANAGDKVTITDINGNVLLAGVASAPNALVELWDKEEQRYTLKQSQWVLSVRDSGQIYLYK